MFDWRFAMVPVRQDKSPQELRLSAKVAKDGKVVQRVLGIALILDGRGRSEAASLVGLDPQTLARAVQHYNADGIAGLSDRTSPGRPPKLTREQSAELKRMVLAGPEDRENGCPEFKVRHIVDLVKDQWGIGISPEPARTRLHAMNLVPLVCRPKHHEADPVAQAAFKETFPEALAKIKSDHPEAEHIEVWVQDESRVGQKGKIGRRWAEKGSNPTTDVHGGFQSVWLFGAFCAERDGGAALVVEAVSTAAMNAHLAIIAQTVLPHNHAAVVVDGAGFHAQSKDLVVPANMTLVTLPAHSPELNPAEGVWRFLKNGDLMHRLSRTVNEIIDRCCSAWNALANEIGRIRSLCSYPWLMGEPAPT
jgi:transposase